MIAIRNCVLATLVLAGAGCSEPSAVVRVCTAIVDRVNNADNEAQCQCVDAIARRQLGPQQYAVLQAAAEAVEQDESVSYASGLMRASDVLVMAWSGSETPERVIAAGDIALITAKAATQCNK